MKSPIIKRAQVQFTGTVSTDATIPAAPLPTLHDAQERHVDRVGRPADRDRSHCSCGEKTLVELEMPSAETGATLEEIAVKKTIPILMLALCACGSTPEHELDDRSDVELVRRRRIPAKACSMRATQRREAGTQPTRPDQEPRRELGAQEGSRVYLLELYQKAMEEERARARGREPARDAGRRARPRCRRRPRKSS
jgi:hypothetical protein